MKIHNSDEIFKYYKQITGDTEKIARNLNKNETSDYNDLWYATTQNKNDLNERFEFPIEKKEQNITSNSSLNKYFEKYWSQGLNGNKIKQDDNTLYNFLKNKIILREYNENELIFPFGINDSQAKAVRNAFAANFSVIEGPPGTGKTQTILNIISNIIIQDKTVAIVSNNNSAVNNVFEKLKSKKDKNNNSINPLDDIWFLCAQLGKKEFLDIFFSELSVEANNASRSKWQNEFNQKNKKILNEDILKSIC